MDVCGVRGYGRCGRGGTEQVEAYSGPPFLALAIPVAIQCPWKRVLALFPFFPLLWLVLWCVCGSGLLVEHARLDSLPGGAEDMLGRGPLGVARAGLGVVLN